MKTFRFLKYSVFFVCCFNFIAAKANSLDPNGVLIGDHGEILFFDHNEALTACLKGTHLPTIREMLAYTVSHGAEGIIEKTGNDEGPLPGYELVVYYVGGARKEFFYSAKGYRAPEGKAGKYFFYSSDSLQPLDSRGVGIRGDNGTVGYPIWRDSQAVLCFKN